MYRRLIIPCVGAAIVLAAWTQYRLVESRIAAEVYRDRLLTLNDQYESLRHIYNQAVRRTAVTELVVENGHLAVVIRTMEGVNKRFATPFDPNDEIYVDYAVVDGRLWIRRVFDARTPPQHGLVIDPFKEHIKWADSQVAYGKAVYRQLTEGRWVVTVTGDGSLGLRPADPEQDTTLVSTPKVSDYPQIEKEISHSIDQIRVSDVIRRIVQLPQD